MKLSVVLLILCFYMYKLCVTMCVQVILFISFMTLLCRPSYENIMSNTVCPLLAKYTTAFFSLILLTCYALVRKLTGGMSEGLCAVLAILLYYYQDVIKDLLYRSYWLPVLMIVYNSCSYIAVTIIESKWMESAGARVAVLRLLLYYCLVPVPCGCLAILVGVYIATGRAYYL